uniref:Iron sulfur protein large subunit of 2-hydroxypyridine dioxygenase n=1 Tax=Rhodococcus sp. PY11 TaxID=551544 RepID=B5MAD4_9NOCA|nr:iron sulfur protein large subunit of 2-hydroxypyridine dioxygenase [Rhodococcus sp. PY11]
MTATVDQTDTGNLGDDNIARKWSYRYPELGIGAVTTDRFISQEQFDRERRDVFAKSWVNIGSVHDLDGNSSFFTRDIKVLGASLLVVQDKKGDIRAFHNVCSHRQNKLVWEDKGPCSQFISCRFHGWAFSQQGNLASVPDDGEFHFDAGGDAPAQSELGLVAVHTEVWNGFIFVNLGENPESLEEYLGPLGTSLKDFPFQDFELRNKYEVPDDANWKVVLDAQNEIYHLPMLAPQHRFLGGGAFATNEDGYTRLADFELMGLHTVFTSDSDPNWHDTPLRSLMAKLRVITPHFTLRDPFVFHVLFPNMVIGFLGDFMFTYNIWPEAVGHSIWEIRMHFPRAKSLADRVTHDLMKVRFRDLLCEDVAGHAAIQEGLESRARSIFVMGDQEIQIRAFHKNLDDYMNRANNA